MPDRSRPTSTHGATHRPQGLAGRLDQYGIVPARTRADSHRGAIRRHRRPASGVEDRAPDGMGWFDSRALYASSSTGADAVAFVAGRDVDSMPVELQANVSKGLLIVSSFQTRPLSGGPERRFARVLPPGRFGIPRAGGRVTEGVCGPAAFLLDCGVDLRRLLAEYKHDRLRHRVGLICDDG